MDQGALAVLLVLGGLVLVGNGIAERRKQPMQEQEGPITRRTHGDKAREAFFSGGGGATSDPPQEQARRTAPMPARDPETSADIAFGQYVVVTARWILVAAGLVLSLWVTSDPGSQKTLQQVQISFVVLALLAFGNFYLNLQLLRKRPALDVVAYGASAADLFVITVLIAAQGGFSSNVYIFYFPALLAISVAFSRSATIVYTTIAILAYATTVLPGLTATFDQQTLITRVAMFAAVAFCGHMYFTIEHDRRRDAAKARDQMTAALGQR